MADWSSLPCDLCSDIALKLDVPEECVYFSYVCRSFNRAFSMIKPRWCSRMPWLLLAERTKDNPDCYRNMFSLSGERCFRFKLPQTYGAKCFGSSCGWVVTINLELQVHLFNPLTQAHIHLPPQPTMPNQTNDEEDYESKLEFNTWIRNSFVIKAIVVEVACGDFIVFAIHGLHSTQALAFARPGDQQWTSVLNPPKNGRVHDICGDGRKLYILYHDGILGYFDISRLHHSEPLTAIDYTELCPPKFDENVAWMNGLYIVESFGHLLMVLRYKNDIVDDFNRTSDFEVYQLNLAFKKWEQLDDLGDVALLIGYNHSMSVRASSTGNFKCNCIYFTDDDPELWHQIGGRDMGVFDMETRKIEAFYNGDDKYSEHCTPLWFWPKL